MANPDAPQLLSPIDYAAVDVGSPINLVWLFSDADPLDVQSQADVRYQGPDDLDWTTVTDASTDTTQHYALDADALDAYTDSVVEWQARTKDTGSNQGPWSTSQFFRPVTVPAAATIVSPTTSIGANAEPVHFTTPSGIVRYELQLRNAAGTTVLLDTIANPPGAPTDLTVNLPSYAYVNGTDYEIRVRWQHNSGVWTAWATTGAIPADLNAPSVPTVALTGNSATASVSVAITNPGGDPNAPDHNNVYRTDVLIGVEVELANDVAVNGTYVDHTPGFNREYSYRVAAVTADGTMTSSA